MQATPRLDLVAFDSGIYHAGLLRGTLGADENLCPLILELARRGAFRVLVLNTVVDELCRWAGEAGRRAGVEGQLLAFLEQCHAEWPKGLRENDFSAQEARFHAMLRHRADATVAVEVWRHQPDYLVHCNPRHWGRLTDGSLGSVMVVGPRSFLREIGIAEIPERRRPVPRRCRDADG
jgi:hypothetical protein